MHKSIRRLFIALSMLATSIVVGMIGFTTIEEYGLLDAFYMTVITFSTVGFTEVHPLSESGRVFTGIYIILNFGIFAYIVSVFTSYFFEGELKKVFKNFLTDREVKKQINHVIVCGFGRNGAKACEELYTENVNFVVIDTDVELFGKHPLGEKFQVIIGDATEDDVLREARIEKASQLITTLPKDTDNVFITLTAKELNPNIKVIARASETNSEKKLMRAGASKVIMPDMLGGLHMAQLITKPYVIEFLDMLNGVGDDKLDLEEFNLNDLKQSYKGKTLKEMDIRRRTGVTVIAFKDGDQGFHFNPHAEKIVDDDDVMIVLGHKDNLERFKTTYCN